jgi:hypothetical protein
MAECCEQQGLTVLALQTDEEHIPVFGSRAPTVKSCTDGQSLEGIFLAVLANEVPTTPKSPWKGPRMDEQLFCGHGRVSLGRVDQAGYPGESRQ